MRCRSSSGIRRRAAATCGSGTRSRHARRQSCSPMWDVVLVPKVLDAGQVDRVRAGRLRRLSLENVPNAQDHRSWTILRRAPRSEHASDRRLTSTIARAARTPSCRGESATSDAHPASEWSRSPPGDDLVRAQPGPRRHCASLRQFSVAAAAEARALEAIADHHSGQLAARNWRRPVGRATWAVPRGSESDKSRSVAPNPC